MPEINAAVRNDSLNQIRVNAAKDFIWVFSSSPDARCADA
jgi:hypothetical protein